MCPKKVIRCFLVLARGRQNQKKSNHLFWTHLTHGSKSGPTAGVGGIVICLRFWLWGIFSPLCPVVWYSSPAGVPYHCTIRGKNSPQTKAEADDNTTNS